MKFSRSTFVCLFLLLATSIGFSYLRLSASPSIYVVCLDSLFSITEQQNIVDELNKTFPQSDVHQVYQQLKKQFPAIKEIVFVNVPGSIRKVFVSSAAPQARVNDDLVINDQGFCIAKTSYDNSFTDQLIPVSIPTLKEIDHPYKDILKFVQTTPSYIYDDFSLIWSDKHHIELHNKKIPDFVISCGTTSLPDQDSIAQCHSIYEEMKTSLQQPKKCKEIVVDIRFERQMIAFFKEGELDGTHIK